MPKIDKSGRFVITIGVPKDLYVDFVAALDAKGLSLPDAVRGYMRAVASGEISVSLKIERKPKH